MVLGKVDINRKGGRPNNRWRGSVKEGMVLIFHKYLFVCAFVFVFKDNIPVIRALEKNRIKNILS